MVSGGLRLIIHIGRRALQAMIDGKIHNIFFRQGHQLHRPLNTCIIEKVKKRTNHFFPGLQRLGKSRRQRRETQLIVAFHYHQIFLIPANNVVDSCRKRKKTSLVGNDLPAVHIDGTSVCQRCKPEIHMHFFPLSGNKYFCLIPEITGKFPDILVRIEIIEAGRDRNFLFSGDSVFPSLCIPRSIPVQTELPHASKIHHTARRRSARIKH